jgi:hypothetical protein
MRIHLNKKSVKPFEAAFVAEANAAIKEIGWELRTLRTLNGGDYFGVAIMYAKTDTHWIDDDFYGDSYTIWPDGLILATSNREVPPEFPWTKPPEFPWTKMETLFRAWIRNVSDQILRRKTAYKVSNMIRQELVAAVWHPRRVAKRLEEGGWEAIENMEAV